jgi:hypothetical protein
VLLCNGRTAWGWPIVWQEQTEGIQVRMENIWCGILAFDIRRSWMPIRLVLAKENFRWKKRKLINLYKMPFISEFSRILYTTIGPSNFSFSWIIWIIQNRWLMAPGRRWKEFGRRKREMNGSASSANNWFEAKQPKNKKIGIMYNIIQYFYMHYLRDCQFDSKFEIYFSWNKVLLINGGQYTITSKPQKKQNS